MDKGLGQGRLPLDSKWGTARLQKLRPRFTEGRSDTARGVHPTVLPSRFHAMRVNRRCQTR
jgi:hypothetical protein